MEKLKLKNEREPEFKRIMKDLQAQRRKLISEELERCRENQAYKPLAEVNATTGHHRTIFQRVCHLIPERKRLAGSLFATTTIRSETGRSVLRDLIALVKSKHEVAVRPGLEPEKCCCANLPKSQGNKSPAERWRHIHKCYRTQLLKTNNFVEFCYFCSEWFTTKASWHKHYRYHLDEDSETLPVQCAPLMYGGTLASPGLCPCCLGNMSLPIEMRMHQFSDKREWDNHIQSYFEKWKVTTRCTRTCPLEYVLCQNGPCKSFEEMLLHLEDMHRTELLVTAKHAKIGTPSCKRGKTNDNAFIDVTSQFIHVEAEPKPLPSPTLSQIESEVSLLSSSNTSPASSIFDFADNISDDSNSMTEFSDMTAESADTTGYWTL